MSNASTATQLSNPIWPSFRALMGTGLSCAILIVWVFHLTKPVIEIKRQAQLEAAIFDVLPGTRFKAVFYVVDGQVISGNKDGANKLPPNAVAFYAGFDERAALTGIAIKAQGMGYQDTISVLYGYKPAGEFISGLRVLDSKETPGLGDKIEKDSAFVANFAKLDASLDEQRQTLRNDIVAVKNGEKNSAWQIDGITGATISSEAIAMILHRSASEWLPVMQAQIEAIKNLSNQHQHQNQSQYANGSRGGDLRDGRLRDEP